ncbi:helix-turn-helix domain-containing protein [Agromyces sp. G08B096]|uniref:Helix-turn-helix domain-containing protein n=1 Tax=Agromyces sp. G08B096 TaxID=3156399 RepID=A0AAU7W718_9MICO
MPPTPNLADLVMHPVRLRIIQQLGGRDRTTAELRAALPDVSQATLYRHVAALVDAGVIAVADERRVRGAVERTLTLGSRMAHVDAPELRGMEAEDLRRSFLTFLAHLGEDFDRFAAADDADSLRDSLGFGQVPLYATQADLADIQSGLGALLQPYLTPGRADARRVLFSTVLLPDADAESGAPRPAAPGIG